MTEPMPRDREAELHAIARVAMQQKLADLRRKRIKATLRLVVIDRSIETVEALLDQALIGLGGKIVPIRPKRGK